MRLQAALAASSLILSAGLSLAAPARAMYFSDRETIFKANPDGTGKTVLFQNAIGDGFLSGLKVDSKNGHLYWLDSYGTIYRGYLDGTGAEVFLTTDRAGDFIVAADSNTVYYALDREGVYAHSFASGESTPIWEVTDSRQLIYPSLYYDASNSTLYWSNSYGGFWKWTPGTPPEDLNRLPITLETGEDPGFTDIDFRGEFPIPYSFARDGILAVGGMDGNAPQTYPFGNSFGSGAKLKVDPEGGFIYIAGLGSIEVGGSLLHGIFRSKLDGSELTLINALEPAGQLALDTAAISDS